ncbi:MAG: transcriptional repressor [Acidimicrobiales bacterium]|nr:transcriptional repressor [Acidimicrobiales bacterium]
MRTPTELTQAFRDRGLKVTPQRQCIFRILHGAVEHPSADRVYERAVAELPTISLRTVYQTLNDLAEMGEIQALELGTGSARFDPTVGPHHHLVCDACGRVHDLHVEFPGVQVPSGLEHGFRVTATEIVFRGLCAECRADDPDPPAPPASPTTHRSTLTEEHIHA